MTSLLAINNYYYYRGGAETVFLEHNRMFVDAGWQVVPFAMSHPKNLPSEWSSYFIDEIEMGGDYSLMQKLVRVPRVIYSRQARRNLGKLLDAVRPDICHGHNIYHHISPSIFSLLQSRSIPTVLTLHDLKIACPSYNMLASDGICERCKGGHLYNVAVHRCIKGSLALSGIIMMESILHRLLGSYRDCVSRFVVPSRFYIDKFVEWGWPRETFRYVPNFVDADRYDPCYASGEEFLYFGRVSREKGVATLIRAAAKSGVALAIVGTGPQLEELTALAQSLKAKVRFLGYLTGDALHQAVRAARAVVLPSEWYENAPMTILEAYALGKPVLGARIGGIPEMIKPGHTGLTCASGDVDSLAEALTALSSNSATLEAMGHEARLYVEENFSAARYFERISGIYRELGVAGSSANVVASAAAAAPGLAS